MSAKRHREPTPARPKTLIPYEAANIQAQTARIRSCTLHLIDLMHAFDAETVGQGRAAYVAKHELAIEPDQSVPVRTDISRFVGSSCSSPAGWME